MPKRFSKHAPVFSKSDSVASSKASPAANASSVVFIHSQLDDYGLSASVFRLYCHLARRAGSGIAWPSIATMSHKCRLHPQTIRKALRLLVAHRFLLRQQRKGQTTLYRLTPPSEWRPRRCIDGDPPECSSAVSNSHARITKQIQGHPSEKDVVKGNPPEGNPPKVNPQQTHRDVPIELPGSVQEAVAIAVKLGIDESFARQEFHNKKAVGWKDGYNNPIVSWPDHLLARWPQEQRKRNERRSTRRPVLNRPAPPSRQFTEANYKQSIEDF